MTPNDPTIPKVLTYPGDITASTDKVIGGRAVVIDKTYDPERNVTLVKVAKLRDPLRLLLEGGEGE